MLEKSACVTELADSKVERYREPQSGHIFTGPHICIRACENVNKSHEQPGTRSLARSATCYFARDESKIEVVSLHVWMFRSLLVWAGGVSGGGWPGDGGGGVRNCLHTRACALDTLKPTSASRYIVWSLRIQIIYWRMNKLIITDWHQHMVLLVLLFVLIHVLCIYSLWNLGGIL